MSDFSLPDGISDTDRRVGRCAKAFMAEVRDAQRAVGRPIRGRVKTADRTALAVVAEVAERAGQLPGRRGNALRELVPAEVHRALLGRFFDLCHRHGRPVHASVAPAVYRRLGIELAGNCAVFGASAWRVLPATLYHGVLKWLPDRFPEFCDTPSLYRHAVVVRPTAPELYLASVLDGIPRLAANAEFAELRDLPWLFRRATVNCPSDPEGYLRRIVANIERIRADARFTGLRDTPSVVRLAAVNYPTNPDAFLIKVLETAARLTSDERYTEFRTTPSIFLKAAVYYGGAPEAYLDRIREVFARLVADPRFAVFRSTPSVLRHAAVNYQARPEAFLQSLIAGKDFP